MPYREDKNGTQVLDSPDHRRSRQSDAHVLHVTAAPGGGVLRHVLDLSEGCHGRGVRVSIGLPWKAVSERRHFERLESFRDRGIRVLDFGLAPSIQPFRYIQAALRIRRFIKREAVDVLHFHSSRAGLLRLLPVVPSNCPVVFTPHAFSFMMPSSERAQELFRWIERIAGRGTDALIAVSDSEGEVALAEGIIAEDRLHVIANGLAPKDVKPHPSPVGAKGPQGARVLSLGRLAHQKNPLFFVDVAETFCTRHRDVEFRWVGDGELHEAVRKRLAVSPCAEKIQFIGHVDDVLSELQSSTVLFSGSLYEGLPYAGLEALACGLPVVASDVVGNRDLVEVGCNGALFPVGSVDAAVAMLEWALESPSRLEALSKESRRIVQARYGLDRMLDKHVLLYSHLADAVGP